jgi:nucleoside-diphosphate-sugar epimerase
MDMKFLITGANGFIGQVLCDELLRQGQSIRAAVRSSNSQIEYIEPVIVGSMFANLSFWASVLKFRLLCLYDCGKGKYVYR